MMKTETTVVTNTHTKIDVVDILRAFKVPDDATDVKVWVEVPGGGDWSNMQLDIGLACPLNISYRRCKCD